MRKYGIKIEKGVPMPAKPGSAMAHPWKDMEIGDSVLVGASTNDAARSMAYKAGQKLKRKFEYRQTDKGFRIWRVE